MAEKVTGPKSYFPHGIGHGHANALVVVFRSQDDKRS